MLRLSLVAVRVLVVMSVAALRMSGPLNLLTSLVMTAAGLGAAARKQQFRCNATTINLLS